MAIKLEVLELRSYAQTPSGKVLPALSFPALAAHHVTAAGVVDLTQAEGSVLLLRNAAAGDPVFVRLQTDAESALAGPFNATSVLIEAGDEMPFAVPRGSGLDDYELDVRVPDYDVTPAAFTFTDTTSVVASSVQTSDAITVSGLASEASVAVTITGGTYSKNGAAYVSTAGVASNGDIFTVRHTASASAATAVNTALTIGGVSDTFTSTTAA